MNQEPSFESKSIQIRELILNRDFRIATELTGNYEIDFDFMDTCYSEDDIQEMHNECFIEQL